VLQQLGEPVPRDLSEWSLHCYCLGARTNPKSVVALDNNGVILHQAVEGVTLEALGERGVSVTESQLQLLERFRLLERDDRSIRTRFPVLFPDAIGELRDRVGKTVAPVIDGMSTRAKSIESLLGEQGLSASLGAVVFGHALDGELWDVLRDKGGVPETSPTVEEPNWRGSFWAAYPGRALSAGTNERRQGPATLVMVWDERTVEHLRQFEDDPTIGSALAAIESEETSLPVTGQRAIPVIRRSVSDPVHRSCRKLAEVVATAIPSRGDCRQMLSAVGVAASMSDATVIIAHEVIWESLEALHTLGDGESRDEDPFDRLFVRID